MKKPTFKILILCILLSAIDLTLAGLEYALFSGSFEFGIIFSLVLTLIVLYFILKPYFEMLYDRSIRSIFENEIPKRRSELLGNLAETINNAYYKLNYYDSMQLQKNALNQLQSFTSSKYEMIKIAVHAISYSIIFFYLFKEYFFLFLFLFLFSFYFKYRLEKKQVDSYISNVHEDKVAEYYRNVLFNPESMHDIKVYGGEKKIVEKSVQAFQIGLKERYRLRRINALFYPLTKTVILTVECLFFVLLIWNKNADLASLVVSMSCVLAAISHIDPLCEAVFQYKEAKSILDEYSKLDTVEKQYNKEGVCIDNIAEIRFENVCFEYQSGKPALNNISFTWKTNSGISLIGKNGSGKTTLIKLLLGVNKPTSGCIFVNNIPLEEVNLFSYLECLGVCLQDYVIFEDELWNNLTFGRAEVSLEKTFAGARADLLDFIEQMPAGIHTHLGSRVFADGCELSVGQEQRLALCRAIAKNCDILILDEPSAALDPQIEYRFFLMYKALSGVKPTFLVTHRIGFASLSNRIIVMENGSIVEDGDHDGLMKLRGSYYKMFQAQSEMYDSGDKNEDVY